MDLVLFAILPLLMLGMRFFLGNNKKNDVEDYPGVSLFRGKRLEADRLCGQLNDQGIIAWVEAPPGAQASQYFAVFVGEDQAEQAATALAHHSTVTG